MHYHYAQDLKAHNITYVVICIVEAINVTCMMISGCDSLDKLVHQQDSSCSTAVTASSANRSLIVMSAILTKRLLLLLSIWLATWYSIKGLIGMAT